MWFSFYVICLPVLDDKIIVSGTTVVDRVMFVPFSPHRSVYLWSGYLVVVFDAHFMIWDMIYLFCIDRMGSCLIVSFSIRCNISLLEIWGLCSLFWLVWIGSSFLIILLFVLSRLLTWVKLETSMVALWMESFKGMNMLSKIFLYLVLNNWFRMLMVRDNV